MFRYKDGYRDKFQNAAGGERVRERKIEGIYIHTQVPTSIE